MVLTGIRINIFLLQQNFVSELCCTVLLRNVD